MWDVRTSCSELLCSSEQLGSPGGCAARRTQVAQWELTPTACSNAIDLASGASRRRAIRAREVDGNGVPACAARAKRAAAGVAGGGEPLARGAA